MTWLFAVLVQTFAVFAFLVTLALSVELCRKLPDNQLRRLLLTKVD